MNRPVYTKNKMSKKSDLEFIEKITKEFFTTLTELYSEQLNGYHSDLMKECNQMFSQIESEEEQEKRFDLLIAYFDRVLDYLKNTDLHFQEKNELQWFEYFNEKISEIRCFHPV